MCTTTTGTDVALGAVLLLVLELGVIFFETLHLIRRVTRSQKLLVIPLHISMGSRI